MSRDLNVLGLLEDIGVDDIDEAEAVIAAILNQNTNVLTAEQQSLLGTGIYRDVADALDITDAAGNEITRTSAVTLPSGQVVESRHRRILLKCIF